MEGMPVHRYLGSFRARGTVLRELTASLDGHLRWEAGLMVDRMGTALMGGFVFPNGGLSLLLKPVWDRLWRSKAPCKEAVSYFETHRAEQGASG